MTDTHSDRRTVSTRDRTRRTFLSTVGAGVFGGLAAVGAAEAVPDDAPSIDAPDDQSWQLVWRDEFDGSIDDAWTHETGGGCGENARLKSDCPWGNEEEQYYTDGDNAAVEDGSLVIEAREETAPNGVNEYTSGRLKTQGEHTMQYGRLDVRATFPEGQGIWPAIWMLGGYGWPDDGEIDVAEFLGDETDTIHATVHGPGYSGGDGINTSHTDASVDFSASAHTYSIVWQDDRIDWYVDGEEFHSVTRSEIESAGNEWVFDHDFFFLLNVAVGGSWPGYPDETTEFPQQMVVDHVRQFEAVESTTTTTTTESTPEIDSIDGTVPEDPDDDGLYEDINANGKVDFPDVNRFFQHSDSAAVQDHVEAYDFTDDGSVDLQDVLALFDMV
ncbi:MAG: family 16 glycosylhydrolase [Halococcoides sp.]